MASSYENRDRSPEYWSYMRLSELADVRFVLQPDEITYESEFLDSDTYKVCMHNLPDAKGFATHNLLVPHPTKANLWKIVGRRDNILILASGENVVPDPFENTIVSSSLSGVVIFGHGRDEVDVLLERQLGIDRSYFTAFRNLVWQILVDHISGVPKPELN